MGKYKIIDGIKNVKVFSKRVPKGYYWRVIKRKPTTKKRKTTDYNKLQKAVSSHFKEIEKHTGEKRDYGKYKSFSKLVSAYYQEHKEELKDSKVIVLDHVVNHISDFYIDDCRDEFERTLTDQHGEGFYNIYNVISTLSNNVDCDNGTNYKFRILLRFNDKYVYVGNGENLDDIDFDINTGETETLNDYFRFCKKACKIIGISESDFRITTITETGNVVIDENPETKSVIGTLIMDMDYEDSIILSDSIEMYSFYSDKGQSERVDGVTEIDLTEIDYKDADELEPTKKLTKKERREQEKEEWKKQKELDKKDTPKDSSLSSLEQAEKDNKISYQEFLKEKTRITNREDKLKSVARYEKEIEELKNTLAENISELKEAKADKEINFKEYSSMKSDFQKEYNNAKNKIFDRIEKLN